MLKSNLGKDAAISMAQKSYIPTLDEIADRFFSIDDKFVAHIKSMGYIPELKRNGRGKCVVDVKMAINLLNRGISLEPLNDADLRKFRNSLIYYNEYFCKSEENDGSYKTATKPYKYIEDAYRIRFKIKTIEYDIGNPFTVDILKGVYGGNKVDKLAAAKKAAFDGPTSIKSVTKKDVVKKDENRVITMYEYVCGQMPKDPINFLEFCSDYDNIEFLPIANLTKKEESGS